MQHTAAACIAYLQLYTLLRLILEAFDDKAPNDTLWTPLAV
jgi:hypothetical protein